MLIEICIVFFFTDCKIQYFHVQPYGYYGSFTVNKILSTKEELDLQGKKCTDLAGYDGYLCLNIYIYIYNDVCLFCFCK